MAAEEGTVLPILPQEIIIEVLLRLPVKSLVKFRCVCKQWLSLISSPQFAKNHLKRKGEHYRLVFGCVNEDDVFIRSINLDSFIQCKNSVNAPGDSHFWTEFRMTGSCNGLICLLVGSSGVFLWNPSIGKSKALPPSGSECRNYFNIVTYGFGYDELNDDYKVVEAFGFMDDASGSSVKFNIFSLRTNSWRQIKNWPAAYPFRRRSCTCALFVNGSFHWSIRANGGWKIYFIEYEN